MEAVKQNTEKSPEAVADPYAVVLAARRAKLERLLADDRERAIDAANYLAREAKSLADAMQANPDRALDLALIRMCMRSLEEREQTIRERKGAATMLADIMDAATLG